MGRRGNGVNSRLQVKQNESLDQDKYTFLPFSEATYWRYNDGNNNGNSDDDDIRLKLDST